jgi:hypothetical protein
VTKDGSGNENPTWFTIIGWSEFACVIAENTASYPLDHEHEKHRENSRKNERNSTRTRGMQEECLLKEEGERGWRIKGEAMGEIVECAHWLALLLGGAWAMACELLFSRDLRAELVR